MEFISWHSTYNSCNYLTVNSFVSMMLPNSEIALENIKKKEETKILCQEQNLFPHRLHIHCTASLLALLAQ